MPKRKSRKRTTKKKPFFNIKTLFAIFLIIFFSLIALAYFLYSKNIIVFNEKPVKKIEKTIDKKQNQLIDDMKKLLQEEKENIAKKLIKLEKNTTKEIKKVRKPEEVKKPENIQKIVIQKVELKQEKNISTEPKTFPKIQYALAKEEKKKNLVEKKVFKKTFHKKPKLAIIIDDVSFASQTKKIKQIPYKVTPAFFPPSKTHPNTPKLAKDFRVHMIHLPLEAIRNPNAEIMTLKKGASYEKIKKEVRKIKSNFPRAKYYNNHTGSKFTSDLVSMQNLLKVLKEENIKFLDSRTTPHSKAYIAATKYHMPILSRDVFLDNSMEPKYIKNQLKQAIKIAKKRGKAIAIGHPYKSTLRVLKNSKPMLKGLELVYINEL